MARVPFAVPTQITRFAAGSRDDKGRYTEGATSTPTINMCIQPLINISKADQDLMNRFGVRAVDGMIRIYSESALYTDDKAAVSTADRLTHDGETYEIKAVGHWPSPREHWRCIACLADEKTI